MDPPPPYQKYSPTVNISDPHRLSGTVTSDKSTVPLPEPISVNNSDRTVWLCPHLGLDFNQAKRLFSTIPVTNFPSSGSAIKVCEHKSCNTNLKQRVRKYQSERGNLAHELMSTVKLFWSSTDRQPRGAEGVFSLDQISTGLHGLDFPICAHLRLNQSFILSRFNSKCIYPVSHGKEHPCTCYGSELRGMASQNQSPLVLETCKNRVKCATCLEQGVSTMFTLFIEEYIDETGQRMVLLSVCCLRGLGNLKSTDELAWLTNTVKPHELTNMASIWQDWECQIWKLRALWFEAPSSSRDSVEPSITAPPINEAFNSSGDSVKPSTTAPPVKDVMHCSKSSKCHFSLADTVSTLKRYTQNAKGYLHNLRDSFWVRRG